MSVISQVKFEPHQIRFLKTVKVRPRFYFAWGLGSGKTFMGAVITGDLFMKGGKILVVCTPSLISEWLSFLENLWNIPTDLISVLRDKKQKDIYILKRKNIVIATYNAFLNTQMKEAFIADGFNMIILDEAHKIKNPKGKMAKGIYEVVTRGKIPRRYLFSASIISKDYKDVFMQFKIMDDGRALGDKYSVFENKYFYDKNSAWRGQDGYYPKIVENPGMFDQLLAKIKPHMDMIQTRDVVKLPKYEIKNVLLTMGEEQGKHYKRLLKNSIFLIEELDRQLKTKKIERFQYEEHILGVVNKLRQMASGFYYYNILDENDKFKQKVRFFPDCPKAKFLRSFLRRYVNEEKIIVWFHFRVTAQVLEKVCQSIGHSPKILMGGVLPKKREQMIRDFKEDPKSRILLANPKSGGEGLNLAMSRVCIYYTQDYSYKDDYQSSGRNYRRGSEIHDKVVRINLRCKDSIDDEIFNNLNSKSQLVKKIVSYIRFIGK